MISRDDGDIGQKRYVMDYFSTNVLRNDEKLRNDGIISSPAILPAFTACEAILFTMRF